MSSPAPLASERLRTVPDPCRLLLVEDSHDYAMLVRNSLERAGTPFVVDHARRLDEALDLLDGCAYDAVLLDLSLPDAFGAFTIRCACARANDVPIIVLTGTGNSDLSMTAVRAGAQAYLVKSQTDRRELPGIVLACIERHRELRNLWSCAEATSEPDASLRAIGVDALRDPFTHLPNEADFINQLSSAFGRRRHKPMPMAVLILEIDGWAGLFADEDALELQRHLVCEAAVCLASQTRTGSIIARLTGPRFAWLLDGIRSSSDIIANADALQLSLGRIDLPDSVENATQGHPRPVPGRNGRRCPPSPPTSAAQPGA